MNIQSFLAASAAAFCIASATAPVQAALVPIENGRVTRDTETGLEWLDLWTTSSLWPERMLFHLRPGGLFEGWRYATLDEVAQLFRTAGIPDITYGTEPVRWTKANYEPVLALIDLVSVVYPYGCFTRDCPHSEGITGTSPAPGESPPNPVSGPPGNDEPYHLTALLSACGACGSFDEVHNLAAAVVGGASYAQDASGWPGHWLVRATAAAEIAEPGALLLLGAGLLGLAGLGAGRRKANRIPL
jgi:hypothetical protein